MNRLRRKLTGILTLEDSPAAIARGIAIGTFFGFIPVLGFKTLLALAVSRLFRGNLITATIAVTLHDLLLPLAPFFLIWEYRLGCHLLGERPASIDFHESLPAIFHSVSFTSLEPSLILGSAIISLPFAIASYAFTILLIRRKPKPPLVFKD